MDLGGFSSFLAGCLPFLLEAGRRFGEDAAKELGASSWDHATRIWARLRPGLEARPAALEAAVDVARTDDPRAQGALALQLEKVMADAPELAADVAELWAKAKASGVMATGERSVAVGGDVRGSTITTGDHNTIGR